MTYRRLRWSRKWGEQSADHSQQRCLATSRSSNERDELAPLDLQINIGHGVRHAEFGVEVAADARNFQPCICFSIVIDNRSGPGVIGHKCRATFPFLRSSAASREFSCLPSA